MTPTRVRILYRNSQGRTEWRTVDIIRPIEVAESPCGPKQPLLHTYEPGKGYRTFPLNQIERWEAVDRAP